MGILDDLGKGFGGILSNPGVLALGALAIGLIIFRVPITQAFENFGKQVSGVFSPAGPIFEAGQEAGQAVFGAGQQAGEAVFGAGQQAGQAVFGAGQQAGQAVFEAGKTFGDFVGSGQKQIDQAILNAGKSITEGAEATGNIFTDFGSRFAGDIGSLFGTSEPEFIGPPDLRLNPDQPLTLADFANRFKIQQSEAFEIQKDFGGLDFEAIAAIPTFGEVLKENPELTASQIANLKFIQAGGGEGFDFGTNTGQALELAGANFGSDVFLQRENENFALLQEAEALRAQATLGGGSDGLFANPDFPITLGEAFLGKSGTVVSQSISNLSMDELKDFIEQFG